MKQGGHNYHPSRVSQRAKMEKKRAYDALQKKKPKPPIEPIDLKNPDWSLKP